MSFEGYNFIDELNAVKKNFSDLFGNHGKTQIVITPASLILFGDHTHYNHGVLLSAAVDRFNYVQIRKRDDKIINLSNSDYTTNSAKSFSLSEINSIDDTGFKVIIGLIKILQQERIITSGFDCVFSSSIPDCVGLGATAALEVGFAFAVKKIFKAQTDVQELFKLIRQNELKLIGKISNKAHFFNLKFMKENKFLYVDLKSLEHKSIPTTNDEFNIIICDTGERIINPQDTCNERITECEVGVKGLRLYIWGIKSLRDIELEFLLKHFHMLPKKIFNRVLYNVKERIRAEEAIRFLKNKSLKEFGRKLIESHWSLVNDYEILCDKCNFLVTESDTIKGVFGSKMISCSPLRSTFHIVEKSEAEFFTRTIKAKYLQRFGQNLTTHTLNLSGGLKELNHKEIRLKEI